MWKLVLAECRYHWLLISAAYAFILFLAISHLLFKGATWQIISTTSSTILILPLLSLINSSRKEIRHRNAVPLPIPLKKIGMARMLAPIAVGTIGLAIPWLFVLVFSPATVTPVMVGRSLLLLGFLIVVSTTHLLILDLKHIFTGNREKTKYVVSAVLLYLFLVVMFASIYMLQYPHIHHAANLQYFEYQMNNYPGVLIFGLGFILTGVVIFMTDILVFQRRLTFLE